MPIRTATAVDIPAILALEQTAPQAAHWSSEQYSDAIGGKSSTRLCLVIEDENTVQGFLVAREVAGEWELENLVVSSSQRRRGLGRQLLNALLQSARAQNASVIFLEVRSSNAAAQALYKKCGFIHSSNRHGYYQRPVEDAALYRLDFV